MLQSFIHVINKNVSPSQISDVYSKNLTFEITFERHVVWGQQFSMAKFNPWMDDFFPIVGGKNSTPFQS